MPDPVDREANAPADADFVEPPHEILVERLDGGPVLVIEDPAALALDFFTRDASSFGAYAYDDRVGTTDPDRIVGDDITNINTTMRARSPRVAWADFLDTPDPLRWLAAIRTTRGLFEFEDDEWSAIAGQLNLAMTALLGPYRNMAVATKVLHAKRPRLFPILDSLVVETAGGVGKSPAELLDWFRAVGRANRFALGLAVAELEHIHLQRTEVRVLDALLWAAHPASSMPFPPGRWERRIGTARQT